MRCHRPRRPRCCADLHAAPTKTTRTRRLSPPTVRRATFTPLLYRHTAPLTVAPPPLQDVFLAKGAKFAARTVPTPPQEHGCDVYDDNESTTGTTTGATGMTTVSGTGAQYSVNGAQPGRVEVVRRQVTRSGRVKLKLVLRGATVDRCVMCATQFRECESAALSPRCQHA